ncbi:MAG: hypothetical protein NZM31_06725 [Gemmatales bacterium]|nr:hypothetical protein [Gemmatales bacterium]MDW8386694.1 hypothetical protein [Gemmatales bacterium]
MPASGHDHGCGHDHPHAHHPGHPCDHDHHHNHEHDHDHGHGHEHGHVHSAEERNAYFLDQLSMIGVAGTYAGVVLAMFYGKWAPNAEVSVINIIVPWIQYMLLAGAILLLGLALLRGIGVWRASKDPHFDPHAGHDHGPNENHAHGWSPWKYIPLVLPLVLYIGLGVPDSRMIRAYERDLAEQGMPRGSLRGLGGSLDAITQAQIASNQFAAGTLGNGLSPALLQAVLLSGGIATEIALEEMDVEPDARPTLGELEVIAENPLLHESYTRFSRIEVEGNFYPASADGTFFHVVRLRVACCLGDARPAMVMCTSRKPITGIAPGDWVAVQGKISFVAADRKWYPVMRVYKVYKKKPPAYPYLK